MLNKSFFINSIFVSLLLIFALLFSCKPDNNKAHFYYWKQEFSLNENQKQLLRETNSTKLYIKFFDVVRGLPTAKIQFSDELPKLEIVPCIYITNESIENEVNIENLAFNVNRLLQEILQKQNIEINEIQVDCDWTVSTKNKYFEFLNHFKSLQNEGVALSATLCLHQLKYPDKTGVPPADKVLLMCYNVGDIQNQEEENSIFELGKVEKYMDKKTTYPLPMDFALPVFSWAVVYRFEYLSFILNNVSFEELEQNQFLEKLANNTFRVKENHYFNNSYFYKDDILRHEAVSTEALKNVLPLFKNLKNKNSELLFFDLSNTNALNYSNENYKSIISKF